MSSNKHGRLGYKLVLALLFLPEAEVVSEDIGVEAGDIHTDDNRGCFGRGNNGSKGLFPTARIGVEGIEGIDTEVAATGIFPN